MAAFGEFFKGRQLIPVEPVMTIGAFDMDGGFGRTACIGREIEFAGHFDLRALALWNGFCAGRILAGVSWVELVLLKRWLCLYGFKPIKLGVSAFAGNSIWLFCFAANETAQTLLQLPFVGVGVDDGAHSLEREDADQQGKDDCKQDGDSVHVFSPFVLVIRFEIQKTVLACCGMITHLP